MQPLVTRRQDARMRPSVQRVPDPTPLFWATKAVSTALGEAASDFSIHVMPPVVAVLCGFAAFVVALVIQLGRHRYTPWAYWLTVAMVGVFGTMAADVVHVAFGVPYPLSTLFYALVLAAVFARREPSRCMRSPPPAGSCSTGRLWSPRSRWARPSATSPRTASAWAM
jgi:uncharacterized membrane-anchored protein